MRARGLRMLPLVAALIGGMASTVSKYVIMPSALASMPVFSYGRRSTIMGGRTRAGAWGRGWVTRGNRAQRARQLAGFYSL